MKKVVKIRAFTYHEEREHPYKPGEKNLVERVAGRGAVLEDLREYDLLRGEDNGAFLSDEEAEIYLERLESGEADPFNAPLAPLDPDENPASVSEDLDWNEASADEIALYLEAYRPDVNETIEKAGDDADTINRVLEAEDMAKIGPEGARKGVLEGLSAAAGRA